MSTAFTFLRGPRLRTVGDEWWRSMLELVTKQDALTKVLMWTMRRY